MNFEQLLSRYEKPIYNLILRIVGDYEEAADLTQDVFIAAYKGSKTFRNESSLYTWLYRIAVNLCKNRFRKNTRKKHQEIISIEDVTGGYESTQPLSSAGAPTTPWESLDKKELRKHIENAILCLPYDYRVLIVLRDIQGLSYQEIADIHDMSIDVVRTRLARARASLRKILEPYLSL